MAKKNGTRAEKDKKQNQPQNDESNVNTDSASKLPSTAEGIPLKMDWNLITLYAKTPTRGMAHPKNHELPQEKCMLDE